MGCAATGLADGVASAIGDGSMRHLEWAMTTPLRRVVLDLVFWQLPRHLNDRARAGAEATVRWRITDATGEETDVYEVVFAGESCRTHRGARSDEVRLTITIERTELLRLVTGTSDPMQAYFKRRLGLSGDLIFAAKLVSMFRIPRRRVRPASVSDSAS